MSTEYKIDCPALHKRSSSYPFGDRVPRTVRMLKTVTADPMPGIGLAYIKGNAPVAKAGQTYPVWTNSHGAVTAVMGDGVRLGLRPAEFEVDSWHNLAAEPAQQHPEPLAWMVGTAFWWTKEEAERDAAATGKPVTPFGPMTGTAPPAQRQGEPAAIVVIGANNTAVIELLSHDLKVGTELYAHTDRDEVERLRSIERSYGLREALLEQVKGERDRMIARTMELAGQLANQDALLHKLKEALQREYWDEYAGLDETRELIDAALSASQEPSTPAAPYPNRLCHIDYTAHPHRCGCLKGDEEAQRRYDEHCRAELERQP
ncbi:hypothetical protein [Pseudomonas taiwanensis]|uniref:hypothetical protein n=1 Tax=Pseudomonas taiwanensis TaxID=470150 RepID=UPI001EE241D4|nr:hypothetical protein [Pseudomonas taiwanensis]